MTEDPVHVVSFSGGVTSWAAARLVKDEGHPVVLLFADTLIEDPDTYRFIRLSAAEIGVPITRIADGRTPWQVLKDRAYLPNGNGVGSDPCSELLKRVPLNRWMRRHHPNGVLVVGLDAFEEHRLTRMAKRKKYRVRAPLAERGMLKRDAVEMARKAGLPEQRLYRLGHTHANCGGGCVKAGISAWIRTYHTLPDVYAKWEREEAEIAAVVKEKRGYTPAMLNDRRNGTRKEMSLADLRKRIESAPPDLLPREPEEGGCGCAID